LQVCVTETAEVHWPSLVTDPPTDAPYPLGLLPIPAPLGIPSIALSPLQWLALASTGALTTSISASQIVQLFQEALCCIPERSALGDMPRLPEDVAGAASTPCSLSLYILK
jgi:hypothetical protein